jgi:hypothetical protein
MRKVFFSRRNLFWSLEKVPTNLPLLLAVNCQIPGAASWAIAGKDTSVCALSSGNGEMLLMSRLCEAFSKVFLATSNTQILKNFLAKDVGDGDYVSIA